MTDRNVFLVVFRTPRGRLSETRGSSEGPVITELPDDYEVDNVKAVKGVNDSSNDSNDNIDTYTDVAANALVNDDNALNTNARAKPVENKQSGCAYTNLGAFEETAEKTNDQCTPKHEDGHTHFTLGFQFTTKDLPSNHPSNFIRSNDRDFKHVFTNEPTKHDTKELEIESPTGHESDLNDSSKPRVSANRNGTHLSTVSAYHPDYTHKPDASQDVAEAKKQNSWNATFSDNDHKNLSDRSQTEPFVFFGAGKPVTANDAHRIEAVTSKNGHSNQRENDEHIANCPKCFKQKYCQHKEIKEMRCCQGCCKLSIQCTSCKKKFSEEELLILTEKRSAKLNKNTIPRKSKRSFVESKEAPNKPSTKEKYPSTNSLDPQCLFDDLVASVGLNVRNVSADGNCMFTAVVDQLRIHGNFTYTPRMLRAAVVGFLRQNPQLDNDTHLQEFVEEPWEKYLDNMSQDGHWGDHVVIRGLANLLNTKIRIYRELYDGLNTTDTLPDNVKERSSRLEKDITKHEPIETDEATRVINLGHLFEMHYVSLRPQTWKEQLLKVLENECEGRDSTYPAGSANVFEVPTVHMSFALKYFARQKLTLPSLDMSTLRIEGQMHDCNVVHNEHHDVLYEYTSVTQRLSDMYNSVALLSPNDTFVISKSAPIPTEYRYYLQPVINTNTTVLLQPTEPTVWKRCLNDENFLRIMFPSRTPDDRLLTCMAFFCEMPEHMSSQWMTRKRPHSWQKCHMAQPIRQQT
ncbi:uncharacterized protein LOC127860069 [Dreissena polymorpha]|uniref:uncharacterized protein LOC127860069 n=1 Tax=Dreissena polymorpha TaxID=45954 RepID=UPI002263E023|nr:uncharacterized protein LOC127860069 [Dreissena polymorpha]